MLMEHENDQVEDMILEHGELQILEMLTMMLVGIMTYGYL